MINYKTFTYEGSKVNFSKSESGIMVNATEMAKPFGKRPSKWLELPSTKEFSKALSDVRKSDIAMVYTKKGGDAKSDEQGGTWFHRDVALEFARWLSPVFAIWCNDRIYELLTTGYTTMNEPMRQYDIVSGNERVTIEPSVLVDAIIDADGDKGFKKVAGSIMLTNGRKMTQPQFLSWLHDNGYLCEQGGLKHYPTEKALYEGVIMIKKPATEIRYDRPVRLRQSRVRVTPKGFIYFVQTLSHPLPNAIGVHPEQKSIE
jgi:phage antirepressor YoqD-like protein